MDRGSELKKVTIKDIAREAGVSVATVSRVLSVEEDGPIGISEKTAEKIRAIARRLGYVKSHAASRLKKKDSLRILGVIFASTLKDVASHVFFLELIWEIEKRAWERGYALVPLHRGNFESKDAANGISREGRSELEVMKNRILSVGASSLISMGALTEAHFDLFDRMLIPFVVYEQYPVYENVRSVYIDYRKSMEELIVRICGKYRRFFFLSLPFDNIEHTPFRIRYQMFREYLVKSGCPSPQLLTVDLPPGVSDQLVLSRAREVVSGAGFRKGDFVLAAYDILAVSVHQFFRKTGFRLGEEVGLCGFDDLHWVKYLDPPVSTVRLPRDKIAVALLDLLDSARQGNHRKVEAELVVRSTF